jgi:hypothetical protein
MYPPNLQIPLTAQNITIDSQSQGLIPSRRIEDELEEIEKQIEKESESIRQFDAI